ncbi:hypothetical protein [Corallococcus llansteffanensis]|uniref:tRNA nuclease CdiA C-terminal domain-containing protein n=1 Tax=Corallococcus llansteffanensis TaxID=2316731 RepID=A0A3A8PPJ8_9BACT|nr:hypothetical protein [Corallococcus llansteffanensis]RKH58337.1 hypothetical protein D7V93_16935 [Corallococcus llansteffanensis]
MRVETLVLCAALFMSGCASLTPTAEQDPLLDDGSRFSPTPLGQPDAFERLLLLAGLEPWDELPLRDAPLTPRQAARLLAILLNKPLTMGHFPPRMGASLVLREVLEGGAVSRDALLHRVERFHRKRVAVLRPDGYLAWVDTGLTQQHVAPVEWRDGALRAGNFELGRFYVVEGDVFLPADERLQATGWRPLAEIYNDADIINRSLDGAGEAFFELVMAIGKLFTSPTDSFWALRQLPAGVASLVASSPEYLERFQNMTRGEQIKAVAKLTTILSMGGGVTKGATRTLTVTMGGAEATVPVLSLSAEGALVIERIALPLGQVATAMGTGAGRLYVLSAAADGGQRPNGGSLQVLPGGNYSPSELNSARALADAGSNVVLRPPRGTREAGGTSDLLVNGVPYDVYTPTTSNANRIVSAIAKKNSQAEGVVLDLSQTSVTRAELGNVLERVRGAGATHIQDVIILGGN